MRYYKYPPTVSSGFTMSRAKRSAIEKMARYQPIDFLGKKEDEPSMEENWLEITKRILVKMRCTLEEKLECATSLL